MFAHLFKTQNMSFKAKFAKHLKGAFFELPLLFLWLQ